RQAESALEVDEVPVGCVVVDSSGNIIASGRNATNETLNGTAHAEFVAINSLEPRDFTDCELYVTVEPCIMCASALRQLRFRNVFFGCWNEKFGGCGGVTRVHAEPSSPDPILKAYGGHGKNEAIMLLRRFYLKENFNAPEPKKKSNRTLKELDKGGGWLDRQHKRYQ
ncbi:cytidine deaminase-like protein, partial [Hyaloraphidium curvatum]